MKSKTSKLVSFLSVLTLSLAANASLQAQTLLNGDFSSPNVGASYEQSSPPDDFVSESGTSDPSGDTSGPETIAFDGTGGVISSQYYKGFEASPTDQLVYMDPDNNFDAATRSSGDPAITGIYQDLGALKPLTLYTVQIYESTGSTQSYADGSTTFQLALYNGTDDSTTPVATTTTAFDAPTGAAVFTPETVSFKTGAVVSGSLTFGVSSYDTAAQSAGQVFIAAATLTATPLPEPSISAMLLLGLGTLALGLRRAAARQS